MFKPSFLLFIVLLYSNTASSKTIHFGRETVSVLLPYKYNSYSKSTQWTVFRFPLDVYSISRATQYKIEPLDSTNPDYSELRVRPYFSKGNQLISFELSDGTVVDIKISVTKEGLEDLPPHYDFKPRLPYQDKEHEFSNVSQVDFIRAVISNRSVNGAKTLSISKSNYCRDRKVHFKYLKEIKGRDFKAYKIKVRNRNKNKEAYFSPEKLFIKNHPKNESYLVHIDKFKLKPRESKKLTIVLNNYVPQGNIYLCGIKNKFVEVRSVKN